MHFVSGCCCLTCESIYGFWLLKTHNVVLKLALQIFTADMTLVIVT